MAAAPAADGSAEATAAVAAASITDAAPEATAAPSAADDTIVQFVVVRRDLLKTLEWPVGSVIAQACHACTAALWTHREDASVQAYLSDANLGSMYKVVKECKGETQLLALTEKLTQDGIAHHLNLPTAIALKPYPRGQVAPLLKKYQLFK